MATKNVLRPVEAPVPADMLKARFDAIRADDVLTADIRDAWDNARRSGVGKGYDEMVAASAAVGLDWIMLSAWKQEDGRSSNPEEELIRTAHNLYDAPSSPLVEQELKNDLALLSNASNPDVVTAVKQGIGGTAYGGFPQRDKGVTPAEGLAVLKARLAEQADPVRKAQLQECINAVNNRDAIGALARKLGAIAKAKSRFRAGLFAHLLHPLPGVPEEQRGSHYESINRVALAAHKTFGMLSGQEKTTGGPGERLRVDVEMAVAKYVDDKFGKKIREEASAEDKAAAACNAVARAADAMFAADLITSQKRKSWISDARKAMADKFSVEWSTPEEIKEQEKEERKAKAAADKLAADEAAGKVAKPVSRKAKKEEAIRKARATQRKAAPPSEPVVTTPLQTDDDVVASLTA